MNPQTSKDYTWSGDLLAGSPNPPSDLETPEVLARGAALFCDIISIYNKIQFGDRLSAEQPSIGALLTAVELTYRTHTELRMPLPARMVVSPSGSVVIEWELGAVYLEAEIEEEGLVEWMVEMPEGVYSHWESTIHLHTKRQSEDASESLVNFVPNSEMSDSAVFVVAA